MWRWVAGGAAAVLLAGGVTALALRSEATAGPELAALPPPAPAVSTGPLRAIPAPVEASPAARAERRLARYDRNDDGSVSRAEYLDSRRRSFARLDADRDGRLSFEEYAIRTAEKFGKADADRNGALSPSEFATTAPKPRPVQRACPPDRDQADG